MGGYEGTKHQISRGVRADFVIAGEPTNFDIVNKTKGILIVTITAHGITAHGAYPWRGKNAIWEMNSFLQALKKRYPFVTQEQWKTTLNLSSISTSNQAFNKIPDDCTIALDIRYLPGEANTIIQNLRRLLPRGFTLNILVKEPAQHLDENSEWIKGLRLASKEIINKNIITRGAHGSSDVRHFARVGGAGVEFGPIGGGIGSDNEWVDVASLDKYYQILVKFLLSVKIEL